MPGFDHFDFLAPHYEKLISFDARATLMARAALPCDGLLLDAGGGTGRVAVVARPHVGNVIVADVSTGMLRESRGKDLPALLTPTEQLPFPNAAFSRILMVDALHHVSDQRKTASELWRVLAPGGRLVIIEPDLRRLRVKFIAVAEKLALMRSHFLSPVKMLRLFEYENAYIMLGSEGMNAWVMVDKNPQ